MLHALVTEPHPYLESDHKYVYTSLIFLQKELLLSLMVNGISLLAPVCLGFNPRCLHIIFFNYVIIMTLQEIGRAHV